MGLKLNMNKRPGELGGMGMRLLSLFFTVCVLILAAGCISINVDYDYDPAYDFSRLQTYDWFPVPRENVRFDLLIRQFKNELKNQLHVPA